MNGYVSLKKMSKKAKKEYFSKQRKDWGGLSPVTRRGGEKGYKRASCKADWKKQANFTLDKP